jgi:hypothetical protein
MTCKYASTLIEQYLDGTLPPRASSSIADHLASCAACRHAVEDARRVQEALRLPIRHFTPPDVLAIVKREGGRRLHRPWGWNRRWSAIAAVIVVCVILVFVSFTARRTDITQHAHPRQTPSQTNILRQQDQTTHEIPRYARAQGDRRPVQHPPWQPSGKGGKVLVKRTERTRLQRVPTPTGTDAPAVIALYDELPLRQTPTDAIADGAIGMPDALLMASTDTMPVGLPQARGAEHQHDETRPIYFGPGERYLVCDTRNTVAAVGKEKTPHL